MVLYIVHLLIQNQKDSPIPFREPNILNLSFFRKLGTKYEDVLDRQHANVYRVRNALVHEYIIKANSKIVIEGGECGIDYNNTKNKYTFYVRRYLEDFKFAVNNYISELMTDVAKFNEAKKALDEVTQLL